IRVVGIDHQHAEVEGSHVDAGGGVHHPPGLAAIVGATEAPALRLDRRVDYVGLAGRDRDPDAPELAFRHSVRDLLPGIAAVAALVEAAARTARREGPGLAPELPHAGVDDARILGIDRD